MAVKNEENKFTSGAEIVYNKEEQESQNRHLPTDNNDGIIIHTDPKEKSGHTYQDRLIDHLYKDTKRALELCSACSEIDYPQDTKVKRYNLRESLSRRFNDLAFAINFETLNVLLLTKLERMIYMLTIR